jgi:hypothetical protein
MKSIEQSPPEKLRPIWKNIYCKSKAIISPAAVARNRTLRAFAAHAVTNATNMDDTGVVYVVIYPRTRQFYIGQTSKDVMTRLRVHHSKRNATHHSELSQFMSLVPHCMESIYAFPIAKSSDTNTRISIESNFIDKYSHNKGLLNRNEKFRRARAANRCRQPESFTFPSPTFPQQFDRGRSHKPIGCSQCLTTHLQMQRTMSKHSENENFDFFLKFVTREYDI